jgi:hypothetical protein
VEDCVTTCFIQLVSGYLTKWFVEFLS